MLKITIAWSVFRLWCALLVVAVAAGCNPAYIDGEPNPASPYYDIPTGSRIVLRTAVAVPARRDRVYFQGGEQERWFDVDRYRPYCAFALASKSDSARTIAPDEFTVRGRDDLYLYGIARKGGMRSVSGSMDQDGGTMYQVLASELSLSSEKQPFVNRLICASWGLPQGRPSVTLNDIRAALGERFTLELAEGEWLALAGQQSSTSAR